MRIVTIDSNSTWLKHYCMQFQTERSLTMALITQNSLKNNIRVLEAKQLQTGLSSNEAQQLQHLNEFIAMQDTLSLTINSLCSKENREEIEAIIFCKYLELRQSGTLNGIPPARYIRRMVRTAVQNEYRHIRRSHGILNTKQTSYPIANDVQIQPVSLVASDNSVSYDYADARYTSDQTDSWLDNFDLVSAYVEFLNRELDKCVLWLLWQFQPKPREMAKYLGCDVRQVYAAIQRIKKVTKAKPVLSNMLHRKE